MLTPEIDYTENKLLDWGLEDYFDRMILSSANCFGYALLTEDDEIVKIWENHREWFKDLDLMKWREFEKLI